MKKEWTGALVREGGSLLSVAAGVFTLLALFVLWFFRDPSRALPAGDDLVVAPGEGRVIRVERVDEQSFLGGAAHKISIFLSVFDVHVQRAPVTGTVAYKQYRPGKFGVAWAD